MKFFIIICILISNSILYPQAKWDYHWMLGRQNGNPLGDGTIVSFNEGEATFHYVEKEMNLRTDNATVSDREGNLLFYSNGCYIANQEHEQMENGNGLNPGTVHNDFCDNGYPMIQGMLILPSSSNDNEYYIIHERAPNANLADRLYYSVVDMGIAGGLGGVTVKNVVVLEDSLWQGNLSAVRHSNNVDWWVIAGQFYPDRYYSLLFDSIGVVVNGFQDFELGFEEGGWGVGQAVFSPDGSRYVSYGRKQQTLLFDFDRSTGELSNPQQLHVAKTIYFGGVAISPNNRFLYVSNAIELYQFDLSAGNIQASMELIDTFDGFSSPFPANFFLMQLAPDCRIYMSTGNGTDRLHVIHYPNRKGKACGFEQHAIQLPKDNASTIPNNPNYRLGTPYPVCDSTIQLVTSSVTVPVPSAGVRVWPNPASGQVSVELPSPLAATGRWSLYNAVGRRVFFHEMERGMTGADIVLEGVPQGLYFWEMVENGHRIGSGKIIVSE